MTRHLASAWYGAFLVDGGEVVRSVLSPLDAEALAARASARRTGGVTPEEATLLEGRGDETWTTSDRRLSGPGVRFVPGRAADGIPTVPIVPGVQRDALLAEGERALVREWDPSIHVQEAVRAAADLDRVRNLIGERLGSWVARDHPEIDPGDHDRAARASLEPDPPGPLAPTDGTITESRRQLARLFRSVEATRHQLSTAIETAAPVGAPNVAALLGPELSARLIAQAGGLERLARLPAGTVQVLGAERAFFEHLRGRAPPPRHGLLFLHPAIQSASRAERGKLARALAGKVAIAARLDAAGAAVRPELARAFEARRADLKARRGTSRSPSRRRRSGLPLDGASGDR
jgi:nucleolar protein 56